MSIDYKVLRESAKLSEAEMANEIGVTRELVLAWETGMISPNTEEKKKLFAVVKRITERGQ